MEFVCYTEWAQLPDSSNQLFDKAAKESIFFSRPWFENLIENGLDAGQSPLLACVLEGDNILAILPLSRRDSGYYHSLKHLYTSLYTLLFEDSRQPEILTCLANGLKQLPVQSLHLDPVAEGDQNLYALQRALEAAGFSSERYFCFRNWIHRVEGGSFADYMAARPSRIRNTVSRKMRKLEREHGYHIRLYTDGGLYQALADYNAVYSASWKANELFEPFINGLAERLARAGWLRLAILYIGDQPAAAQFWFVAHGKASIFKLVYDEAWKQYSTGSILIAWLMEYVIDTDKVEEIDFLTGNDAYKQDWMSQRRDRWRLSFINTEPSVKQGTHPVKPLEALLKWLKNRVYNRLFRKFKENRYATDTRYRKI